MGPRPCPARATIQAPSRYRASKEGTGPGKEVPDQPLLPTPRGARSDSSFLHERMTGPLHLETSECRWCDTGERELRHHLFTECEAWRPQIRRLWRRIGKDPDYRRKRPRAPAVRELCRKEATEAVLEFLEDTRVGCWTLTRGARKTAEDIGLGGKGEEGGPGPP